MRAATMQAHAAASLDTPTLFIGSHEFSKYPVISKATQDLQGKCKPAAEVHTVEDTTHGDFADSSWWLPARVLRGTRLAGSSNPTGTWARIVDATSTFLSRHAGTAAR